MNFIFGKVHTRKFLIYEGLTYFIILLFKLFFFFIKSSMTLTQIVQIILKNLNNNKYKSTIHINTVFPFDLIFSNIFYIIKG